MNSNENTQSHGEKRKKMEAKKCTGGRAPRKQCPEKAAKYSAPSIQPQNNPPADDSDSDEEDIVNLIQYWRQKRAHKCNCGKNISPKNKETQTDESMKDRESELATQK